MYIRDLRPEDIEDCKNIVQYYWGIEIACQAMWELEEMFTSNSKWPPHYYVVEEGKSILGFGGFKSAWLMSNAFELIWVNVCPWARGRGIGSLLMTKRLEEIRRRGGNMVLLMTQKTAFFEKFGFKVVANLDGWELMLQQLAPVSIDIDRSQCPL